MRRAICVILLFLTCSIGTWAQKGKNAPYRRVDFKTYLLIHVDMSEAQVINFLGPPSWVDAWSCEDGGCHLMKVYYYLGNPAKREMTTVIYFKDGKVTSKERYRSWLIE